MNTPNPALPTRPLALKPKWIVVACLLLVVYLLLRPWLVERFGLDLPGFTNAKPKVEAPASDSSPTATQKRDKNRPIEVPVIPEQSEPVVTGAAPSEGPPAPNKTVKKPTKPEASIAQSENPVSPRTETSGLGSKTTSPPPPNSTTKPTLTKPATIVASQPAKTPAKTNPTRPNSTTPATVPQPPKLGMLKPAGRDRFESTAGLIYSQYRIDHVLEHSRDDPDKPSHGVYDGTQDEIFAVIDEAYQIAQKKGPPQVVIENQGERTTYTVNLNRKIGHGGGQSGARRRNPPLKIVKIVLEGDEVITAYPTDR